MFIDDEIDDEVFSNVTIITEISRSNSIFTAAFNIILVEGRYFVVNEHDYKHIRIIGYRPDKHNWIKLFIQDIIPDTTAYSLEIERDDDEYFYNYLRASLLKDESEIVELLLSF